MSFVPIAVALPDLSVVPLHFNCEQLLREGGQFEFEVVLYNEEVTSTKDKVDIFVTTVF